MLKQSTDIWFSGQFASWPKFENTTFCVSMQSFFRA